MSASYATPLRLDIKSSRLLQGFCLLVCVLSMASLSLLDISLMGLLLSCGAVAYLGFKVCQYHCRETVIVWQAENNWRIIDAQGQESAELLAHSFIAPYLLVLNFSRPKKINRCLVVFYDAVDKQQLRRLRVRLKVDYPFKKHVRS